MNYVLILRLSITYFSLLHFLLHVFLPQLVVPSITLSLLSSITCTRLSTHPKSNQLVRSSLSNFFIRLHFLHHVSLPQHVLPSTLHFFNPLVYPFLPPPLPHPSTLTSSSPSSSSASSFSSPSPTEDKGPLTASRWRAGGRLRHYISEDSSLARLRGETESLRQP